MCCSQVGSNRDVYRLTMSKCHNEGMINLSVGSLCVVDLCLVTGNRFHAVDLKVEVSPSDGVVDKLVGTKDGGGRVPSNDNHREVLRISTSNSIDGRESPNPKGDAYAADALGPGVAISCIASVEFIAALHQLYTWL